MASYGVFTPRSYNTPTLPSDSSIIAEYADGPNGKRYYGILDINYEIAQTYNIF